MKKIKRRTKHDNVGLDKGPASNPRYDLNLNFGFRAEAGTSRCAKIKTYATCGKALQYMARVQVLTRLSLLFDLYSAFGILHAVLSLWDCDHPAIATLKSVAFG